MTNTLARVLDALRRGIPVKNDYRITYKGGPAIEWVERGNASYWYVDGERVTEQAARERMRLEDAARRQGV